MSVVECSIPPMAPPAKNRHERSIRAGDVDLHDVAEKIRATCGSLVEGAVTGRQRLKDLVGEHLGCSALQAEALLDAMVAGKFIVARSDLSGHVEWSIRSVRAPRKP